jgi:hypothetical protein
MRTSLILSTLAAFTTSAFSAGFIADFSGLINPSDSNPNTVTGVLNGYGSWTQSVPNPDGSVNGATNAYNGGLGPAPLSWGANVFGNRGASLGTYYDVPGGASYSVSHPVSGVSFGLTYMTVDFVLTDSTNGFPDRNDYSFGLYNGSGGKLFSWDLDIVDPQTVDPDNETGVWQGRVTSTGGGTSYIGGAAEGTLYRLSVLITSSGGGNVSYSGLFESPSNPANDTPFSGTLTGLSAESVTEFRVTSSEGSGSDWGDNFISFTGVSVIPEPATTSLFALSLTCLLVRRRR